MPDEELNELIRRRDRGDLDALEEIDAWIAERLRRPDVIPGARGETGADGEIFVPGSCAPIRRGATAPQSAAFALLATCGHGGWAS